jgi:hypothetical protein
LYFRHPACHGEAFSEAGNLFQDFKALTEKAKYKGESLPTFA